MRYSRALFAAALALSAAACGQSVSAPTEPASGGIAPTRPAYDGGVGWGGGQRTDSSSVVATNSTAPGDSTTAIGENRGNYFGSGN